MHESSSVSRCESGSFLSVKCLPLSASVCLSPFPSFSAIFVRVSLRVLTYNTCNTIYIYIYIHINEHYIAWYNIHYVRISLHVLTGRHSEPCHQRIAELWGGLEQGNRLIQIIYIYIYIYIHVHIHTYDIYIYIYIYIEREIYI